MKVLQRILLLYFLMLQTAIYAQVNIVLYKRCSVKTLNFEQGLSNNATTNIITDANGFTWVSTITGMQRYNGYTFEQ